MSAIIPAAVDKKPAVGNITEQHPLLRKILPDYRKMRDSVSGETAVKDNPERYLPMPDGFRAQKDNGSAMYSSYMTRAQFPDIVAPTVLGMVGVIHRREAEISGLDEGSPLAYLWENASTEGLTLEAFHRKITEEILTLGRVGIFTDSPPADVGGGDPRMAIYTGENIVNWSEGGDFFVLSESIRTRNGFSWDIGTRYRVIQKINGIVSVSTFTDQANGLDEGTFIPVTARGGGNITTMPFVIAGSRSLSVNPDQMPLLGVANSALAIYRLDADYRHSLFMTGQETLVFAGLEKDDVPEYVGAGVAVALPVGGTAVYASPSGAGIQAHRLAILDERENAAASGARVMDTSGRGAESGDALAIRARASTATLLSVALTSAAALEKSLRNCAEINGYDPTKIVVKPNLDFLDQPLTPADARTLMEMWIAKAISYETYYANMRRAEISTVDRTATEEQALIAKEGYITDPVETDRALGIKPKTPA